ncbi:MAG: YcaO-like family protein [Firmicutes bacterium]|nr:YcaO-like family protein [Bacillota bacterium]
MAPVPALEVAPEAAGPELERAMEKGMRLVDERTGIIQRLYDLPLETNDPRFFHVASPLTDTMPYFGVRCFRQNGGCALTRPRAVMAAIGESVERYCGGLPDPDRFVEATPNEMGRDGVAPWELTMFSESQYADERFPLSRPTGETVFRWMKGRSLTRDAEVHVPACFVYVPYPWRDRNEAVTAPISTGLACGGSYEHAVLRGIYEVVERDSFSITWLNRMPVPRLLLDHVENPSLAAVIDRFAEASIDVNVNLATTDLGIPVVITLSLDRTGAGPECVIAARADFDLEHCIMRSLEETAQTRLWARKLLRDTPDFEPQPGYTGITKGQDHVRLFASRGMSRHVQFLTQVTAEARLSSLDQVPAEPVSARIWRCVDALAAKGHEVIAVDVTTPDIAEVGFSVVRIVIPGLHPLEMDHNWRKLGGRRLYEVPYRLGYSDHVATEAEMNPIPHPFP